MARYDLSEAEWRLIEPLLPNKPRGVARVDDRRVINGAMTMGLAPVVGVPMPLLSYGGTVMVTVMAGFGLIQAVRVHRYQEMPSGKGTLL